MEGALKLEEVSDQHAEAYPASELKHGPLALSSRGKTTTVGVCGSMSMRGRSTARPTA
jgi:glucosamine--fructose-6-phosphate aminotransferase (isomerizing)